ncbi:MAG: thrombospondin type 3 repeat-containing protein [Myxococcales bacterium]|nr:thrombospondin type 3 repeat-containing protein [Myxococcales bacterium]
MTHSPAAPLRRVLVSLAFGVAMACGDTSTFPADNDQDGVLNEADNCVDVPNPGQEDRDGDRIGDLCDLNEGGGGIVPVCPDDDRDGICNAEDNCPLVANNDQLDADDDTVGDACEATEPPADSDGDGIPDNEDNCPDTPNERQSDTDDDGIGDVCESLDRTDTDGDGVPDSRDNCLTVANRTQDDADGDGTGDACEAATPTDTDGDGVPDTTDNCPSRANPDQADTDDDGTGDACEAATPTDTDGDGVSDSADNCPSRANADQTDTDGDGTGDACEVVTLTDTDGDGVSDSTDNCLALANPDQQNNDGDSSGDICDACPNDAFNDADADDRCANEDNCRGTANPGQENTDFDSLGDACDACPLDALNDADRDGFCANNDNCPTVRNPDQSDADADGAGDVCDFCPFDGENDPDDDRICQNEDNCPDVSNNDQADSDFDGFGDACDCGVGEWRNLQTGECRLCSEARVTIRNFRQDDSSLAAQLRAEERAIVFRNPADVAQIVTADLLVRSYAWDDDHGANVSAYTYHAPGEVGLDEIRFNLEAYDFRQGVSSLVMTLRDACGNRFTIDDFTLDIVEGPLGPEVLNFRERLCFDEDVRLGEELWSREIPLLDSRYGRDATVEYNTCGTRGTDWDYTVLFTAQATGTYFISLNENTGLRGLSIREPVCDREIDVVVPGDPPFTQCVDDETSEFVFLGIQAVAGQQYRVVVTSDRLNPEPVTLNINYFSFSFP